MNARKRSWEEAWREFAAARGGEIVEDRKARPTKLRFDHGPRVIMYDQYVVSIGKTTATFTRARSLVQALADTRFRISREHAFARLGKLLGMQDLHVGHPELTRDSS